MARRLRLVLTLLVLGTLFVASGASAVVNDYWDIYSGSGTQVRATSVTQSGGPLFYSSLPEYVQGNGKILDYSASVIRFRTYLYHVNDTTTARYIGFALYNNSAAGVSLYVNQRSYAEGTTADPALIGRNAQQKWYATGTADYYIAWIPANSWWYSTNPVDASGSTVPLPDFKTGTVGAGNLLNGIYDFAVVNATTTPVPIRYVSFASTVAKPTISSLTAAAGTHGSNAFCPHHTLNVAVSMDFASQDSNFRYYDLFGATQDAGENVCLNNDKTPAPGAVFWGSAGAYGNYGIEYKITPTFNRPGPGTMRWVATSPSGPGSVQYFAGATNVCTACATDAFIHNVGGGSYDRGREIGYGNYAPNNIATMLTGGNWAPMRFYFFSR